MNPSNQPFTPRSQSSSVIPIVSPTDATSTTTTTATNTAATTTAPTTKTLTKLSPSTAKRQCRNVIIHGFCKFQGKGCEFNHETEKPTVLSLQSPERNTGSVSADAPVFIPKSNSTQDKLSSRPTINTNRFSAPPLSSNQHRPSFSFDANNNGFIPQSYTPQQPSTPMMLSPGAGQNDPFFYMNNSQYHHPHQAPQYHQYAPTLPHIGNLSIQQRMIQSFYIPDNLKEQLQKRNEYTKASISAKDAGLPEEVHVYHSLYRLEEKPGQIMGHASWVYKAICRTNGKYYTMVRIEGFRLVNEQAMTIVKKWRKIKHANIVSIHEAFTTRAFGDSSLIFVYDYHPCSITLFEAYFSPQAQALLHARFQAAGINGIPVPEPTLWSFITQIASALKTIHEAGLSARTIEPTKILMTSKNRLRLGCPGLVDVLQYDTTNIDQERAIHQQEDLLSFGKLVISLACNSPQQQQSSNSIIQSFEYISTFYSPDLKNVAYYLLGKPSMTKSIDEVFTMIGPRLLHELNGSQYYTDTLECNLSNELENSRLVRLMSKLGFVDERPEFEKDPRWSEAGDRYMIKLFRDYVFHQVNEIGVPVVDMAHVTSCLNKLDAGADEKILLTSRDDQTSIIVTYKELKSCITAAFNDIYTKTKQDKNK